MIAPEPGKLPLGILAGFNLRGLRGLLQRHLTAQVGEYLFVSQGFKRLFVPRKTMSEQRANLFYKPFLEHLPRASRDRGGEDVSAGSQTDLEDFETFQGTALGSRRQGRARQQTDFQCAGGLLHITRMNALGGRGLQTAEQAMQRTWPPLLAPGQPHPQSLIARRQGG